MAYITAEEVKTIRNNIKKMFPLKRGWKFSVRGRNHSSVTVSIMQCPSEYSFEGYCQLNHYYIDAKPNNGTEWTDKDIEVLKSIKSIVSENHWDRSDIQSDYFNCSFYYSIHVGQWDKPCVKKA